VPWGSVNAELTGPILPEIKSEDTNSLVRARHKKVDKYRKIESYALLLLGKHKEEIQAKFKVDEIGVRTLDIVVSRLGVIPRETVIDFRRLLNGAGKITRTLMKLYLRRMSLAAIKGSFQIYTNPREDINDRLTPREIDINDIFNQEEEIQEAMWTLNDQLGEIDNLIPEVIRGVDDRDELGVYERPEYRRNDDYAVDRTELRKLSLRQDDVEYDQPEKFDESEEEESYLQFNSDLDEEKNSSNIGGFQGNGLEGLIEFDDEETFNDHAEGSLVDPYPQPKSMAPNYSNLPKP
jgi:hypothetical protein